MKKYIWIIVFVLCSVSMTVSATDIIIDGAKVKFTDDTGYPYIENGHTLVPLRAAMEAYGAEVKWDSGCNTAVISKGTVTVCCRPGEQCIYRNGTKIENEAAASINNGHIFLPIRAVLEALDAEEVLWDGNVTVQSGGAGNLIYNIEHSGKTVSNLWASWSNALNDKNNGNYASAIEKIKELAPKFIASNDGNSNAMMYKHLGECYATLGMNAEAAVCYGREAEFWQQMGKTQETIDADRRAAIVSSNLQIYAKTSDENYKPRINFGKWFEPKNGIYLGAYAEGDEAVHDSYTKFYMNEFPKLAGKDMTGYLLYMRDDIPFAHYESHFKIAKEKNKIMQIALEPVSLFSIEENNPAYIKLAKDMQASGVKLLVRFACEMNDNSCNWYTADFEKYKEKFRIVANIFHTYAPSVAVVWSPNFYPTDNIENYYPGDEYVDCIGVSSYMHHQPETDPFGQNIDRRRWSYQLDTIYSLYGYKKPIIISECGASYMDRSTWADITGFASEQLFEFLTYLPIKYPNIIAMFVFDDDVSGYRYSLSDNPVYLDAYKRGIASSLYLSEQGDDMREQYYELGNNVKVHACPTEICAYVSTPMNDVSYVVYRVNGCDVATAYGIPYCVNIDFTPYAQSEARLQTVAFDSLGRMVADKTYRINVR